MKMSSRPLPPGDARSFTRRPRAAIQHHGFHRASLTPVAAIQPISERVKARARHKPICAICEICGPPHVSGRNAGGTAACYFAGLRNGANSSFIARAAASTACSQRFSPNASLPGERA